MNPKADFYFNRPDKWHNELNKLRTIVLDCQLTEELKWGVPCYSFPILNDGPGGNPAAGKNVRQTNIVLIHEFKDYCAVLFFKGALLKDPKGILVQQTNNVQAARQVRFTSLREVVEKQAILKAYIQAAIDVEKAGLKVEYKKPSEFTVAAEFQNKLNTMPALKDAFHALTPGRQRAYLLHFSAPKQATTRESRVEKCLPQILLGKGLND